jgi:hypothetical protein
MSTRSRRSQRWDCRWRCPQCNNYFPRQTMPLVGKPECNHGHATITMEPAWV